MSCRRKLLCMMIRLVVSRLLKRQIHGSWIVASEQLLINKYRYPRSVQYLERFVSSKTLPLRFLLSTIVLAIGMRTIRSKFD